MNVHKLGRIKAVAAAAIFSAQLQAQTSLQSDLKWSGVVNSNTYANAFVDMTAHHAGDKIVGTAEITLAFRSGVRTYPLTGTYKAGQCSIRFGGATYNGACSNEKIVLARDVAEGNINGILTMYSDGAKRLAQAAAKFPANLIFYRKGHTSNEVFNLQHRGGIFSGILESNGSRYAVSGHTIDGLCYFLVNKQSVYAGRCNNTSFVGTNYTRNSPEVSFSYIGGSVGDLNTEHRGPGTAAPELAPANCPAGFQKTVDNHEGALVCVRNTQRLGATIRETCARSKAWQALTCQKHEIPASDGFFDYYYEDAAPQPGQTPNSKKSKTK